MNNKIAIEALSMDLMRIAVGYHRGSTKMANRFKEEALKRCSEISIEEVKPFFAKIIKNIKMCLSTEPQDRTAEDALMYSVLCKNYAKTFLN